MVEKLLQPAINLGLSEQDFWEMTVAEIQRYTDGAIWRLKSQAQFDYVSANLIGLAMAKILSSETEFPSIEKVYPTLFDAPDEEEMENKELEKRMTDSANRFLAFAQQYNAKVKTQEEV